MSPCIKCFTLYFCTLLVSLSCKGGTDTAGRGTSIFNGRDLSGWDGKPGWWYVEDGALTSESTEKKPCDKCNYLIWKGGGPSDFELTLDFKLSEQGNSGVQLRSREVEDWDTFGYQADMTGDGKLIGFVYHHKYGLIAGRGENVVIKTDGSKEVKSLGSPEKLLENFKQGEWNRYRIICIGKTIELFVNDALMCRYENNGEERTDNRGIIALQMHPGPPMKVQFKNIFLKNFVNEKGKEKSR